MAFVGVPQAGWACTNGPAGYSSYSIVLQSTNSIFAERSFEMAQDGIIHFNDAGVATARILCIPSQPANGVVTIGGTGGGNNNLGGSGTDLTM